jgi:hypothetical protein
MKLTRIVSIVALLIYIGLWVLALNGASSLIIPLVVPLILAAMVAGGVALERFIGVTPRKPKFQDRDESQK